MSIETKLLERSNSSCELCGANSNLTVYEVKPNSGSAELSIIVCSTCKEQIENPDKIDSNHWRCLNDSMWSTIPAVQVMSYRILKKIAKEGWPQDLLDMLYLEDDVLAWANSDNEKRETEVVPHHDSNGTILQAGDTVTIIKDLEVKGAGFTAKRGTAVRNISLTTNPEQVEGRVNGVKIVLLTYFLKKS